MEQGGSIKYDRYAFSREGWDFSQSKNEETGEIKRPTATGMSAGAYTEEMSSIELNSIKKYGGFYIGRYEVGIEGGTQDLSGVDQDSSIAPSEEWTGWKNGKAVVQKDKQVWDYITRDMAKKVAESMYNNNEAVVSRLCSSYAWDTTLQFIETKNTGYATNSEGDNHSGSLNHTGIGSTARNNIYDMGGNVWEWTTEVCSGQVYPCTGRGGSYNYTASGDPAGYRGADSTYDAYDYVGTRSTLFVGL